MADKIKVGNVILIGFMGSGKSTVGIRLSYRLRRPVIDTDKWIEKEQGSSIAEIFEKQGEEAFRLMETQTLKELKMTAEESVIATGGGLPLREENRRLLKELGWVVFLRVRPETVCERLRGDKTRPLLQKADPEEEIRKLLAIRGPLYEKAADAVVDADGKSFEQIMDEILEGGLQIKISET